MKNYQAAKFAYLIKYFYYINNGTQWILIKKRGPTLTLLQETLTDLTNKKQYHENLLADINEKIQSHENALKIIEDATKDRTTRRGTVTVE